MALLRSAFPNTRIDPESTINLWFALYHNEDFEVAKSATELVIKTCDYFPSHNEFGKALFRCKSLKQIEQSQPKLIEGKNAVVDEEWGDRLWQDMIDTENEIEELKQKQNASKAGLY